MAKFQPDDKISIILDANAMVTEFRQARPPYETYDDVVFIQTSGPVLWRKMDKGKADVTKFPASYVSVAVMTDDGKIVQHLGKDVSVIHQADAFLEVHEAVTGEKG